MDVIYSYPNDVLAKLGYTPMVALICLMRTQLSFVIVYISVALFPEYTQGIIIPSDYGKRYKQTARTKKSECLDIYT